jgi:hypothetical protein
VKLERLMLYKLVLNVRFVIQRWACANFNIFSSFLMGGVDFRNMHESLI